MLEKSHFEDRTHPQSRHSKVDIIKVAKISGTVYV